MKELGDSKGKHQGDLSFQSSGVVDMIQRRREEKS